VDTPLPPPLAETLRNEPGFAEVRVIALSE